MNKNLLRSIAAGLLLGVALFIMPFFLIRLIIFFLVVGALFRLFGGKRFRRGGWRAARGYGYMPAFADKIRHMSDDEYHQFKQRFERGSYCDGYTSQKAPENPVNEVPGNR